MHTEIRVEVEDEKLLTDFRYDRFQLGRKIAMNRLFLLFFPL